MMDEENIVKLLKYIDWFLLFLMGLAGFLITHVFRTLP